MAVSILWLRDSHRVLPWAFHKTRLETSAAHHLMTEIIQRDDEGTPYLDESERQPPILSLSAHYERAYMACRQDIDIFQ